MLGQENITELEVKQKYQMKEKTMKKDRLFVDIHVIQTVPPSNVNRDDTGSPKTAMYGGVRRARVSSQSWKRAMRKYFYENSAQKNVGVRTLEVVEYIKEKILELDGSIAENKAKELAGSVIEGAGISLKDDRAKALFFIGDAQARGLAQKALDGVNDKEILKEVLRNNPAIDIALFGRMVADDPSLNEDASSQVAHALSTHAVQTEFDFFTAVDDKQSEDNAGAGMLGTVEYNSSTLYRYANVAVHELMNQLEDKESVINTLKLYIEAFANSMPTGKANTFANQTLPQLILVEVRGDRPVNLVTAFEKPVKSVNGYVRESIKRLLDEKNQVLKFVAEPIGSYYLLANDQELVTNSTEYGSLRGLLDAFAEDLFVLLDKLGD